MAPLGPERIHAPRDEVNPVIYTEIMETRARAAVLARSIPLDITDLRKKTPRSVSAIYQAENQTGREYTRAWLEAYRYSDTRVLHTQRVYQRGVAYTPVQHLGESQEDTARFRLRNEWSVHGNLDGFSMEEQLDIYESSFETLLLIAEAANSSIELPDISSQGA